MRATRGARGGYSLAKEKTAISFLDVIEAVEGPIIVNLCLDGRTSCKLTPSCTMYAIWKLGQERMLEVYRSATLDQLAMQQPVACAADLALREAVRRMHEQHVGSIVIVDAAQRPLGIFTLRDLRRVVAAGESLEQPIAALMTQRPFHLPPSASAFR